MSKRIKLFEGCDMVPPCRFRDLTGQGIIAGLDVSRYDRGFLITCADNVKEDWRLCTDVTSEREM
jgi:hypothetical protein